MFENSSQTIVDSGSVATAEKTGSVESTYHAPRNSAQTNSTSNGQDENMVSKIRNFRVEFGPSRKDILNFTNQLAVMVRAGISLQDCFESIALQEKNQKFAAIITDLKNQIEEGKSFSQALAKHDQVFSNLYVNMIAAAEVSGSLSDMLHKLSEYLRTEAETRSQIKSAMVYPIIIAVMAVAVTIFLLCLGIGQRQNGSKLFYLFNKKFGSRQIHSCPVSSCKIAICRNQCRNGQAHKYYCN